MLSINVAYFRWFVKKCFLSNYINELFIGIIGLVEKVDTCVD